MLKSDIYLSADHALVPIEGRVQRVTGTDWEAYRELFLACAEKYRNNPERRSFRIALNGYYHRASVIHAQTQQVFCVRKFEKTVPEIEKLGLPPPISGSYFNPD